MIHNPRNVSFECLEPEDGWRFLDTVEVTERDNVTVGFIDRWNSIAKEWRSGFNGRLLHETYRTKLTPTELLSMTQGANYSIARIRVGELTGMIKHKVPQYGLKVSKYLVSILKQSIRE